MRRIRTDRVIWLLGWLIVALASLGLIFSLVAPAEHPRENLLTYRLSEPVVFAVGPTDEVRVVTWYKTPPQWAPDPRRSWPYAVALRFVRPDGTEGGRSVLQLRSRVGWVQGDVLEPPSRTEDHAPLTDDRTVNLDIGHHLPEGGTLEVRSVDAARDVFAAVFSSRWRSTAVAESLARLRDPEPRLTARVGAPAWTELAEDWRTRALEHQWLRLGALGHPDVALIQTSFSRLPFDEVPAVAWPVAPGGVATFNLEGDADLRLAWWAIDGSGPIETAGQWRTSTTAAIGAPVPFRAGALGPIVGTGPLTSVEVALDAASEPRLLRAWLRGTTVDRSYGDPPRQRLPDGAERVAPDLRGVILWRADRDRPLTWNCAGVERLRLRLAPRLPPGPLPMFAAPASEGPFPLRVVASDGAGRPVYEQLVLLPGRASAWERYVEGDDPGTARVSDPTWITLPVAPDWATVRLEPSSEVDAVAERRVPGLPEIIGREYELEATGAPVAVRWRPQRETPWQPIDPVGSEGLFAAGRQVRIDGQVRLVPAEPAEAPVAEAEEPEGVARRWFSVEARSPYDRIAVEVGGDLGNAVALTRRGVRVEAPNGSVRLDYRVPAAAVGTHAEIRAGDAALDPLLAAAAGQLRVRVPARASLSVATDGLFLASQPKGPWSIRRVNRADAGWSDVALPPGATRALIDSYACGPVTVSWDGGTMMASGRRDLDGRRPAMGLSVDRPCLQQLAPVVVDVARRLRLSFEGQGTVFYRVLTDVERPDAEVADHHWRSGG